MRQGIDCSTKITKTVAEGLVRAGQTFAARYLVPEGYSKHLSTDEAKIISDAGLDILSCYETTAGMAMAGASGGAKDAQAALKCAERVGQPKGSAIYFAVDFDVTKPEQYDIIEAYLRAAGDVLGSNYGVGVYAEYSVIEAMQNRKACKYFWQTYAWSAGKRSVHASVYQYKNGQRLAGITVDFNNSFGDEGFWNLRQDVTKLTNFPDVPAGHWAEQSVASMVELGIIAGKSDGSFGIGEFVTREQLAVFLARVLKEVKKNG